MRIEFFKMQGIGNDYIYVDCFEKELKNPSAVAVALSRRRYSVGADGLILIGRSEEADASMRIFNADGSEGKMCGNGLRCVGKFLYEKKNCKRETLTVETKSGVKTLYLAVKDGRVSSVTANMGRAELSPRSLPSLLEGERAVNVPLTVGKRTYRVTLVSMGNPHCVVFVRELEGLDLPRLGRKFETHSAFPEGVNTEFVQILGRRELAMRVWERGSGETLACGTGACAAAVASVINGYCDGEEELLVHLRGGDLTVKYTEPAVYMTGGAEFVYHGETEL